MTLLAAASATGVSAADVSRAAFGKADGRDIEAITLSNKAGTKARIITYGASLQSLMLADRHGHFDDVVVGHQRPSWWCLPSGARVCGRHYA